MSKPPAIRKYQPDWEKLKSAHKVVITLADHENMPTRVKIKYLRTIRKAIQKEKYYDYRFKFKYPNAEIASHIMVEEGSIYLELALNDKPLEELFK